MTKQMSVFKAKLLIIVAFIFCCIRKALIFVGGAARMLNEKSTSSTIGDAVLPLATQNVGLSHSKTHWRPVLA